MKSPGLLPRVRCRRGLDSQPISRRAGGKHRWEFFGARGEILERDKNITAERFHRAAKQRVSGDRSAERVPQTTLLNRPARGGERRTYGSGNRFGRNVSVDRLKGAAEIWCRILGVKE